MKNVKIIAVSFLALAFVLGACGKKEEAKPAAKKPAAKKAASKTDEDAGEADKA